MLHVVLTFLLVCVVAGASCAGRRGDGGLVVRAAGSGSSSRQQGRPPLAGIPNETFRNLSLTLRGTPLSRALPSCTIIVPPTAFFITLQSTPIRVFGFRTSKYYFRKVAESSVARYQRSAVPQLLSAQIHRSTVGSLGQVPARH